MVVSRSATMLAVQGSPPTGMQQCDVIQDSAVRALAAVRSVFDSNASLRAAAHIHAQGTHLLWHYLHASGRFQALASTR